MNRRLIAAHLVGNALLMLLGYYWLGLGEARAVALVWSIVVALAILAAASWLHGWSFAGSGYLSMRSVPWTSLIAALAFAIYLSLPGGKWWWIARWIVLPWLFVPLFAGAAVNGWRAWRGYRRPLRWLPAPLFVLAAVWIPLRLIGWTPRMSGFALEFASFAARAAVAYLLFVAGWLALARVTSAGSPAFTQPKTASLP